MERVHLFGFDFISAPDHGPILDHLIKRTKGGNTLPFLITPNVDQLVKYHRPENKALFELLKRSELVLPDGQPIVWTSSLKKNSKTLASRLTGSDLFPKLWRQLQESGKRVFFILPNEELGKSLSEEYSAAGFWAPPMFDLEDSSAYKAVLNSCRSEIENFDPDHVMIGLGFPKQEQLAIDLHDQLSERDIYYSLLGASFEFYLGKKSRAPKWMQRAGLEFIHRLLSEPRRMAKRYLVDDLAFIPLLLRELRSP